MKLLRNTAVGLVGLLLLFALAVTLSTDGLLPAFLPVRA